MSRGRKTLLGIAVLVAACARPAPATPPPGAPGCPVFPEDNVWHSDISSLPVHARSDAWLASMEASTRNLHPDFGPSGEAMPYGIPYEVVDGAHPRISIDFSYGEESDPGPYPLDASTPIEGGPDADGDRHALVVDRDGCMLYETFDTHYEPGGSWAGSGAIFDLRSNALRPAGWTSADAAGLPVFAGLVRLDEVNAGVVDHAIRFTARRTDRSYVWPARHHAGAASDPDLPPMGARFRLESSFDLTGFRPDTRAILQAMKTYGLILADNGSNWFFTGTAEDGWDTGMLDELKSVPASAFEAVDASSLMADPDSGRAATGTVSTGISRARSAATITYGEAAALGGRLVRADTGAGLGGRNVGIERRDRGASSLVPTGSAVTSSTGAFAASHRPARNSEYRYSFAGAGVLEPSESSLVTIWVRPRLAVRVADRTVALGRSALVYGSLRPAHGGGRVLLQQARAGSWRTIGERTIRSDGTWAFSVRQTRAGTVVYRVVKPADADHAWTAVRAPSITVA